MKATAKKKRKRESRPDYRKEKAERERQREVFADASAPSSDVAKPEDHLP